MKYLTLSLLAGLSALSSSAAPAPASVAELFATPENLQLVRTADKTDVCILRHIEATPRPDGSIDHSTERYEETAFVNVPAPTAAALRDLVLSEKTYDWKGGNGGRRPQFYLRLRFHRGEEVLTLDFCFLCHVFSLSRHGEEIGHANFSGNSDLFLQAFLQLFPQDEPLKHVAKEAGLPL